MSGDTVFLFLKKNNFQKRLFSLSKKLKGKTVLIYGAGYLFQEIFSKYDLSNLNIIGITDKNFLFHKPDETFLGYKVYSIEEIPELNPDIILVSTQKFIDIIYDLKTNILKNTNTKVIPLIKKSFIEILKEIWL